MNQRTESLLSFRGQFQEGHCNTCGGACKRKYCDMCKAQAEHDPRRTMPVKDHLRVLAFQRDTTRLHGDALKQHASDRLKVWDMRLKGEML